MALNVRKCSIFVVRMSIIGAVILLTAQSQITTDETITIVMSTIIEETTPLETEIVPTDDVTGSDGTTFGTVTEFVTSNTTTPIPTDIWNGTTTTTALTTKRITSTEPNVTAISTTTASPTTETPDLTTTSKPSTTTTTSKPPTTTPTYTSRPPIIPEPVYPELGSDARKVIVIEIQVLDNTGYCLPGFQECEQFEQYFVEQMTPSYDDIEGLDEVTVIELRNETGEEPVSSASNVVVTHGVSYIWNEMEESQRGLTANEIFEMTVESGIAEGKIQNLTVATCSQCADPQEITQLCTDDEPVECPFKYFDPYCSDGLPSCRSKCLNTESLYCGTNGICTQKDADTKPTCGCLHNTDFLYFGEYCQLQVDKLWFLIGVSIGGFVVILLIVILSVCLVVSRRTKKSEANQKRHSGPLEEELGMQSYGYTNEVYDPSQPDSIVFAAAKQADRPHSYLVSNGMEPSSKTFGNPIAQEAAKKQAEKHKSSAFWGNLNNEETAAENEMQPILTHIDTSEGYRIQRPKSQSSSLPDPDYDAN